MTHWIKEATARVLGYFCVAIFTALVLDVLWGVATRYLLGQQAHWSEELARFLMVWLALIGAALAYIERSHLGVDILTRSLDPAARRVADLITHAAVFSFSAGVMVYGGMTLFLERWQSGQVMAAIPMKKAWFYLSLPSSGVLIAVFALHLFIITAQGRGRPRNEPEPSETASP